MTFLVRAAWAMLVTLLVVLGTLAGFWFPADAKLQELRFEAMSRAPSGAVVFVDIDATSLNEIGTWPWPRSVHGQLLDKLLAMGAYEVAFDVDFSTASSAAEDAALAHSLEAAGGYAYLAAFRQLDARGQSFLNAPLALFSEFATPVLVNVNALEGGVVRTLPARLPADDIDSLALALNPSKVVGDDIRIDFSIDLERVPRIPAIDILKDRLDPDLVRDKQVVIGASAIELHDLFATPRFGIIPGPLVQIAAAETLRLDRALERAGALPIALMIGVLLGFHLLVPRSSLFRASAVAVAVSLAVEAGAGAALAWARLEMSTMPIHVAGMALIALRLCEELILRRKQLKAQRARVAYMAAHDLRTGALSEPAFIEATDRALSMGIGGRIVLIRFARFETISASLGHEVVEAAMMAAHERLKHLVSTPIGRLADDSFIMFLPGVLDTRTLAPVVAALDRPYEIDSHRLTLDTRWSASSELAPGADAASGVQHVRTAMAVARRANVKGEVHSRRLDEELRYRQSLDMSLQRAVAENELSLLYQPQIDLKTNEMVGLEALLRWNSRDHGPVSPAAFIPLAEENGAIVEIGAWVMEQACREALALGWRGRLAVNVSPAQFRGGNVPEMVMNALKSSGFPAAQLDIEITESLFMESDASLLSGLENLRALGVGVAIDDFGTGYSSLNYLGRLPIDKLKIDQVFVRQLASEHGGEIIAAIAALARRLGHHVVVEGVESQWEAERLAAIGCHIAQGYLYSRPAPLSDLLKSVAAA